MTSGLASWADVGFQYTATLAGTSGTSTSTSTTSTMLLLLVLLELVLQLLQLVQATLLATILAFNTIFPSVTRLIVLFL